ncbi:hypothetical protein PHPALM_27601, partial [Phytophthora palmivora]
MDTFHAQKENVDTNVVGNGVAGKMAFAGKFSLVSRAFPVAHCCRFRPGTDKFSTPKRGFVIHEDTKSAAKTTQKESSTKKSRRVLGDISNKQRNGLHGTNAGGTMSAKKTGLGKTIDHSKKLNAKKRTPLKNKVGIPLALKASASLTPKIVPSLTSKSATKSPRANNVPDIEFAYGGLPSPKAESAYVKGLRDEILRDISNDETPTLFDDFDLTNSVDEWDYSHEKALLESGEPPSPWWALSDPKHEDDSVGLEEEEEDQIQDNINDLPPPDNIPEDAVVNLDDDGLLTDLLNVDVEA